MCTHDYGGVATIFYYYYGTHIMRAIISRSIAYTIPLKLCSLNFTVRVMLLQYNNRALCGVIVCTFNVL